MGTRKGIQLFGLISLLVALAGCASHKKSDAPPGATQPSLGGAKWGYYSGEPVKYEGALVARGEEIPRAIPVNPEQINEARDWISNTDPSLEQIEQRANAETH